MKIYKCFIIIMVIFFTSCVPESIDLPQGVWQSEEPNMILFIKPEYRNNPVRITYNNFLGKYIYDEVIRFFTLPGPGTIIFFVYDVSLTMHIDYFDEVKNISWGLKRETLLEGVWRMRGDQIHLTVSAYFYEQLDFSIIIFNEIEYYKPIDINEWITEDIERLKIWWKEQGIYDENE